MTRAEILAEASHIITQDRNNQYGEPEELFGLIAAYWSAHLDHPITAHDVAVMMTLFKLARAKANPKHLDSAVDACGYMAIAGEMAARAPVRPADGQVGPLSYQSIHQKARRPITGPENDAAPARSARQAAQGAGGGKGSGPLAAQKGTAGEKTGRPKEDEGNQLIEEIRGKGANRAKVICDECGRDEVVACGYARTSPTESKPIVKQVVGKIEGMKWAVVKGKHHCPACESKRKAKMTVKQQEKPAQVREPTPKQKREIIGILELVYDDERKRFKDGESDKTVADTIGGGVLWGWVAQVREELFGPDTRNQEVEAIRESIKGVDERIEAISAEMTRLKQAMDALQQAAAGIKGKLDKVSA